MTQAEYHSLYHAEAAVTVSRTQSYALPVDVAACVDLVAPTVHVPRPHAATIRNQQKSGVCTYSRKYYYLLVRPCFFAYVQYEY
jgi:hypothetical protein